MKPRTVALGLGAAALALAAWLALPLFRPQRQVPFSPSLERGPVVPAADYRLSGPYAHANLTVFLVHGPVTLEDRPYLTLQEALEQQKVVVHETGSVGELAIENRSDQEVYVQSGDIVKGGRQDRTFPYDFVAPPHSGRLPIASFCVEQGRWSPRGKESGYLFGSSSSSLPSKELRSAALSPRRSQGEVWQKVRLAQERLSAKLGESVRSEASESSLQLSLESPRLREAVAPYLHALADAPDGKEDVIGCAVAVNGRLTSADVYASGALFRKLWPKLLEGAALEAFAEHDPGRSVEPLGVGAVKEFLARAEGGGQSDEAVTERVYVLVREADGSLLSDTCDRGRGNLVIHRCSLAR
jgi:hypothetical protein